MNSIRRRCGEAWILEKYMIVDFIGALRQCFKDAGFSEIENNVEQAGTFLVAIKRE